MTVISRLDSGNHYKVLWTLEKDGKDTYHWWNSLTITVIMPVLRQHRLKHSMVESADHLFAGPKLEMSNSQDH
ncbi:hypothetical protein Tco_0357962, partial [Tanacetum coccineum]